ncbi:MAG: ChuX/HutX family heme-like substrate-binding protein [Verrucomicrobiota bacterium]
MKSALIRQKREALNAENPKINPREQADRIGVSEGALVASACGHGNIRLKRDVSDREAQLCYLNTACEVLSVSRNRTALLEVKGAYPKCQFFEGLGWMQGTPIDLRATVVQWSEGFYVPADGTCGASLQFFDSEGVAVHKVFFVGGQEPDEGFLKIQAHRNQKPDFEWTRGPVSNYSGEDNSELDHEAFMQKWEQLGELHNFNRLTQRFGLNRLQTIRMAGEGHAQRLNRDAVRDVLAGANRHEIPLEVSIENSGVVQNRSGVLPPIESYGKWMNLLHDHFNLHIDESQVNQVWRVAVPTRHGVVHVLEVFDKGDRPALRMLPSEALTGSEPAAWTEQLESCEPLSIEE